MAKLATFKPRTIAPPASRLKARAPEAARVEARGTTAERGYGYEWQVESVAFRKRYPACAYCWLDRRAGPPEMVDHLYPHGLRRGVATAEAQALFRDKRWWVTSCFACHRSFKAAVEAEGIAAIDALAKRLGLAPLDDEPMRRACAAALADR